MRVCACMCEVFLTCLFLWGGSITSNYHMDRQTPWNRSVHECERPSLRGQLGQRHAQCTCLLLSSFCV